MLEIAVESNHFKDVLIETVEKQLKKYGNTHKAFVLPSDFSASESLGDDVMPWWDDIADESMLVKDIGVHPTMAETVFEGQIQFGSSNERIFKPGIAGTDPGDTATAQDSQNDWKPEEYVATIPWTLGTLEDVRDGEEVYDRFMKMCTKAAANQIEEDILNAVKSGSNNSQRGSTYGCFDGFLEVIRAGGNVVDATSGYTNRNVDIDGGANDKFLGALNLLDNKYQGRTLRFYTDPKVMRKVAALLESKGYQVADKFLQEGVYAGGVAAHGTPLYGLPKLRENYLVQGTGTIAGGADQVNGNGVAKAGTTSITVDDTTGFIDTDLFVIGALAASASYGINAELGAVNGAPTATVITAAAALTYDHDDDEHVIEYTAAPTATGHYALLLDPENCTLIIRREMYIEIFREPRKRAWTVVMSTKLVPAIRNDQAGVLIRDFDA